ncbi:MAG: hypothetical protein IBX61_01125 [Thermoleophilia bacterium]|nr:hypothetical protein [Thermoleophilia bacterium]
MNAEPANGESSNGPFREFMYQARPIRLREPLAETLGAVTGESALLEYSYVDAVKLAGHSCPTVTAAYLSCQEAIGRLYPAGETPVRGDISVTVYGGPDEGSYGVMAQVISLITGAAPATGFKGLGGSFTRKDLLRFSAEKPDPGAVSVLFRRNGAGREVLVRFFPWAIPFPEEKGRRAGELMPAVVAGTASKEERREFQDIWMEKIRLMLIERKEIESWLKVEAR